MALFTGESAMAENAPPKPIVEIEVEWPGENITMIQGSLSPWTPRA